MVQVKKFLVRKIVIIFLSFSLNIQFKFLFLKRTISLRRVFWVPHNIKFGLKDFFGVGYYIHVLLSGGLQYNDLQYTHW